MLIFLNLDGTAQKVVPDRIFQGSAGVTNITVVAPFPSTTALEIGFILPDGLYRSDSNDGSRYMPMQFEQQDAINGVSVWTYALPRSVTAEPGVLQIAINAIAPDGGNVTSYLCEQQIEESVLPNLPVNPPQDVYTLIRQYLAQLDSRTANVPDLVASIQKDSGNSFTYTDNKGVVSFPITLGVIDYNPTYVGASSVIHIPNTVTTDEKVGAWQPVYADDRVTITDYTVTITAAQHGQMRDGATANDLWISFDETENGTISGVYQGYTVSDAGDITISLKTPVAMTVRVWNGKGLVDVTAREQIAAETERAEAAEAQLKSDITAEQTRAETAENNLQSQIDEIEQSGVDLTARAAIEAETERAEAAETQLQSNINSEQSRAQAAENALSDRIGVNASDIAGLREDLINESHFRGMFDSVAALQAAYPTATPNDYAYIIGGNQWIYQNGAWTDSGVPTPNTAIPLSDVTPLMDGVASAGTASEGARSDHRHPSDTNKVNKSGDTMTGPLTLPMLLGKGSTEDTGIVPVRFITRSELGVTVADGADAYIQAWIKKVCQLYPNNKPNIYIGRGDPSSQAMIIALLYETDQVDSSGMIAYATGIMLQHGLNVHHFRVSNHQYLCGAESTDGGVVTLRRPSGNVSMQVSRTDTERAIGLDIGSGGTNRGLYDKTTSINKWIVYWDNDNLYLQPPNSSGVVKINGVEPYSSKNPPKKAAYSFSIFISRSISTTISAGNTYTFSATTGTSSVPTDAIGGIVHYGGVIGYIISTTSFVAITSGNLNLSQGNTVSINGFTIG